MAAAEAMDSLSDTAYCPEVLPISSSARMIGVRSIFQIATARIRLK